MDTIEMMERANQLLGRGDTAAAEKLCNDVLQEEVHNPDAHYLLGVIEHRRGNQEKAEQLITDAIKNEGQAYWYYAALAEVRAARDNTSGAIEAIKEAISIKPDERALHTVLAQLFQGLGQYEEAASAWGQLAKLEPNHFTVLNNLGACLLMIRRVREAAEAFHRAIAQNPNVVDPHAGLAIALAESGQIDEAVKAAAKAAELAPDDAYTHYTNGVVLEKSNRLDEAIAAHERALAKNPELSGPHDRLGHALSTLGEVDAAIQHWQAVARMIPRNSTVRQHILLNLNYQPQRTAQEIFEAHREWGRQFADPILQVTTRFSNTPEPERRLRIGYLSADFCYSAVAMFFRSLLINHNDERFESICFSAVNKPDEMTRALCDMADGWHELRGGMSAHVVELMRTEAIDILVDLGSRTESALMEIVACRAAPVQIAYLGYCTTSGMQACDYVVGDDITDPPDNTQPYLETLLRLPGSFACYSALESAPPVNELPASSNGFVTLASFHKLQKLNPRVLDLWARLLKETPNTRLLIARDSLTDRAEKRLRDECDKRGIGADRLIIRRDAPHDDNDKMKLSVFHQADIALDAFPWSGQATSCNALWMGVPYVTLRWPGHAGRMAASAVTHAGFGDWVADTEEDYVRIVQSLAADLPRLAELRRTIRAKMAASILCDGAKFTREWENALRGAWRKWCLKKTS